MTNDDTPPDSTNDVSESSVNWSDVLIPETELRENWTIYKEESVSGNRTRWFVARLGESTGEFIDEMGEIETQTIGETDTYPSFETKGKAQVAYQGAVAPEEDETSPEHESNVVSLGDEEESEDESKDESEEQEDESVEEPDTDDEDDETDTMPATTETDDLETQEEESEDEDEITGVEPIDDKIEKVHYMIEEIREGPNEPIDADFREAYETTRDKITRARAGDEEAEEDVEDMPERLKRTFARGTNGWDDLIDTVFPLTIGFSGIILLLTWILTPPGTDNAWVLTTPTRYGDLFLIVSMIVGLTMVGFWIDRRIESPTRLRKNSRRILGALQIIPISVVILMFISLGFGAPDLFQSVQGVWDGFEGTLAQTLPGFIVDVGTFIKNNSAYVSVVQSAVLMVIVGFAAAVPFAKRVAHRALQSTATDPENFWEISDQDREEVLTLVTDEDEDDEDEDEEFRLGAFDRKEVDEKIKELIQLPEEMTKSPYNSYREVRRYWVRAPYAYISIVYNDQQNDYRYVVVEPELDRSEEILREEFDERLSTELLFEDVEDVHSAEAMREKKVERLENKLIELAHEYDLDTGGMSFHKLLYHIERDYVHYDRIDPMMEDPNVEDISCDGDDTYVFVFHRDYKDLISNVHFDRDGLRSFITRLAQRSGEHISAADPMVDASLPDGSRAQLTLGKDITTRGSTFTIRLFKEIPFTPIDLLDYDTFDVNQMAYLWLAIEHDKSLIFAGGTASGKTTSMNAVSLFIPPKAKIVTLEDTREISLPHDNWIPGTTRDSVGAAGGEDITMYDLLRSALRQRPEYLIVGEIRGEEAQTLFQAMSTGHTTYSTMHADTVQAAIGRLTNPPINVPRQMLEALDIMCIQQQVRLPDSDGEVRNVRRNVEIRELIELRDNDSFRTHPAYQRDAERDEFVEQLDDSHVLYRIQQEQGWNREELAEELDQRKEVLQYLLDKDITDFELVSRTIQAYMIDSARVIQQVRDGTLDPDDLSDLTNLEFVEPVSLGEMQRRQITSEEENKPSPLEEAD